MNTADWYNVAQNPCGPYDREHKFGPRTSHEERGVLVITHGRRAGRIYTVEQSWTERTCEKCERTERINDGSQSGEWPQGLR